MKRSRLFPWLILISSSTHDGQTYLCQCEMHFLFSYSAACVWIEWSNINKVYHIYDLFNYMIGREERDEEEEEEEEEERERCNFNLGWFNRLGAHHFFRAFGPV